jgi:octopine/nopaline transport system substrate-binding protein
MIKKAGLMASCVVMAVAIGSFAHADTMKVTIATEGAFPPYNLTKPDGTLDGYEIELGKQLCKTMGAECTFVAQPFDGVIPALNAGKFDAAMTGMSMTPKRQQVVDFSESYGRVPQAFAALDTSPLVNLKHADETYPLATDEAGAQKAIDDIRDDLKGKVVGVQTASIASMLIKHFLDGDVTIREYKTTEEHDLDLKAGRIDFTTASIAYLTAIQKKPGFEHVKIVGPHFQGGLLGPGIGVAFRKGDTALKAKFDEAIKVAIQDGTIQSLSEKWFGFDITPR